MSDTSVFPELIDAYIVPNATPPIDQLTPLPDEQWPAVSTNRAPLPCAVNPTEQVPPFRYEPERIEAIQSARVVQTSSVECAGWPGATTTPGGSGRSVAAAPVRRTLSGSETTTWLCWTSTATLPCAARA